MLATAAMMVVVAALLALFGPALAGPAALRLLALAGLIAAGALCFAALILALGVTDWRELQGQLRRRPA